MNVTIEKSTAYGEISAPPSKSMAHRYIICAALANGESVISNVDFSEDIKATIDCIKTLGADVKVEGSTVIVDGSKSFLSAPGDTLTFNCRESGSTMRFFMGIAMTLPVISEFYGSETLRNRPFGIYENILKNDSSLSFERQSDRIVIKGGIRENDFEVAGNISSQFITGLLLALSIKGEGGSIKLIPPVESRSYINMTIQAMNEFGINVGWKDENTLYVESGCKYICKNIEVEGDYSNAAFLDAFNLIGGKVKVNGLNEKSLQGDRIYKEYFEKLLCEKATLDIADCPDLGPVLFAMAAASKGGVFTSTARLKIKESDRGSVMCEELAKFGINTHMEENSIEIGCGLNAPTVAVDGHNDHRIVMSMALLLSATGGTINGAQAVRKSYPGFFEDIEKLGIKITKED